MPGHDILFFGSIDWHGRRKLPAHHVSTLLARRNRVFYIDNWGGHRALRPSDLPRAVRKLRQAVTGARAAGPAAGDAPPVVVHQPLALPITSAPALADRVNTALVGRGVRRLMERHGIRRPVVWTRVPDGVFWNVLQQIPRSLLVYQSVDNFPNSPVFTERQRGPLRASERRVCEAADLVFTSARGLYDLKRQVNPNTHLFVNGVHSEPFAAPGPGAPAADALPRPRIGFAGGLGAWVDFGLVRRAAELTPEWSWVLLGGVSPGVDVDGLDRLPNVHMPGEVPHGDLPAWFRSFDAGIIPYRLTEFTRYTFPSKMAEYMAAGLPVVSTSLPELAPYAHALRFGDTPEAWVKALRASLAPADPAGAREARRAVARSLAWETIVDGMEALIEEALARPRGAAAARADGAVHG
jgi:glycosyltransferase involved in cell wall biosynthesis